MKQVNKGTKMYDGILWSFNHCKEIREFGIYGLYSKPSSAKIQAYNDCVNRAKYYGTITSIKGCGSCHTFSLYIGVDCGNNEKIVIQETYCNTRFIKL